MKRKATGLIMCYARMLRDTRKVEDPGDEYVLKEAGKHGLGLTRDIKDCDRLDHRLGRSRMDA